MGVLCEIRNIVSLRGFLHQHAGASRIARNCLVLAMTRKPYLQCLMPASTTTKRTFSSAAAGLHRVRLTIGEDCSTTPSNSSRVCARTIPCHYCRCCRRCHHQFGKGWPDRFGAGVHDHIHHIHAACVRHGGVPQRAAAPNCLRKGARAARGRVRQMEALLLELAWLCWERQG